ncbi:uncharacterized protein LY89DRAFT_475246 [Mollisia scopiformis]|uniref:Uncharacterized protein n=1 Tax=Mollisia scopiformis TaxID=149040 RepID=A0A194XFX3_MOLSC|nr:uncharacterized protein LY89DRAFT_475246 [Mollisia scopiformis]KUJ19041.1 hypothetical protein LY89DRAFT_475246 [Mollisia scopiformis]
MIPIFSQRSSHHNRIPFTNSTPCNYKSPNIPAITIPTHPSVILLSPPLLCSPPGPVEDALLLAELEFVLVGPTVVICVVVVGPVIVVPPPPGKTQVQVGLALHGKGPWVPVHIVVWPWHLLSYGQVVSVVIDVTVTVEFEKHPCMRTRRTKLSCLSSSTRHQYKMRRYWR